MRNLEWPLACLLLTVAGVAHGEVCHTGRADQAGRCEGRSFAPQVVSSELQGAQAQPRTPPVEADLLATQLLGRLASGELYPVAGADDQWVLVASAGQLVEHVPNDYQIRPRSSGMGEEVLLTALLHWQPSDGERKGVMQVLATTGSIAAMTGKAAGHPPCVVPVTDDLAPGEAGDGALYPVQDGAFHWQVLSAQHRVLAAAVSRSEGYAGGGGEFNADVLLEVRDGALWPVACHATDSYQMIAGNWNPDGTREHDEYQASWVLQPMAGQAAWPRLQLRALTDQAQGAWLAWDADKGYYVAEPVKSDKTR